VLSPIAPLLKIRPPKLELFTSNELIFKLTYPLVNVIKLEFPILKPSLPIEKTSLIVVSSFSSV